MKIWVVNCMWEEEFLCYSRHNSTAEVFRTEIEARRFADKFRDEFPDGKVKVYVREV